MNAPAIGVMFQRDVPPEALAARATLIESLGYDDMWVVEDLFFSGGIAQAAVALAATDALEIGIGILPATARNAVYAAMELGTLARLYPQRLLAGIGHGMQDWMATVGALPRSPLKALEETMLVIGRLLRNETVTLDGEFVAVDHARLQHPPEFVPPLLAGVRGPKSLKLAGQVSDGAILAEPTSAAYSLWAREQLTSGADEGNRPRPTLVSYTWLSIDPNPDVAIDRIRPMLASIPGGLAEPSVRSQLLPLPFSAELIEILDKAVDQEALARQLKEGVGQGPCDCRHAKRLRQRGSPPRRGRGRQDRLGPTA